MKSHPLFVCLALLGAFGCAGLPDHPVRPSENICASLAPTAAVELGTGASSFVELNSGDEVLQGYGAQGGDHVWASLRMDGIFGGGVWDEVPCEDGEFDDCGPVAPSDAPKVTIELLHGERIVAATAIDTPVQGEDGITTGITVFLHDPYSSVAFESRDPDLPLEVPQSAISNAEAAEEGQLTFSVVLKDACGSVVRDEREVSISIPWLAWLESPDEVAD